MLVLRKLRVIAALIVSKKAKHLQIKMDCEAVKFLVHELMKDLHRHRKHGSANTTSAPPCKGEDDSDMDHGGEAGDESDDHLTEIDKLTAKAPAGHPVKYYKSRNSFIVHSTEGQKKHPN